ncbi:hypothetical protein HG531_010067 [Fusarium graminearum]|nr:hypothetical protein HG531_010067 [Fusarium graminearum]
MSNAVISCHVRPVIILSSASSLNLRFILQLSFDFLVHLLGDHSLLLFLSLHDLLEKTALLVQLVPSTTLTRSILLAGTDTAGAHDNFDLSGLLALSGSLATVIRTLASADDRPSLDSALWRAQVKRDVSLSLQRRHDHSWKTLHVGFYIRVFVSLKRLVCRFFSSHRLLFGNTSSDSDVTELDLTLVIGAVSKHLGVEHGTDESLAEMAVILTAGALSRCLIHGAQTLVGTRSDNISGFLFTVISRVEVFGEKLRLSRLGKKELLENCVTNVGHGLKSARVPKVVKDGLSVVVLFFLEEKMRGDNNIVALSSLWDLVSLDLTLLLQQIPFCFYNLVPCNQSCTTRSCIEDTNTTAALELGLEPVASGSLADLSEGGHDRGIGRGQESRKESITLNLSHVSLVCWETNTMHVSVPLGCRCRRGQRKARATKGSLGSALDMVNMRSLQKVANGRDQLLHWQGNFDRAIVEATLNGQGMETASFTGWSFALVVLLRPLWLFLLQLLHSELLFCSGLVFSLLLLLLRAKSVLCEGKEWKKSKIEKILLKKKHYTSGMHFEFLWLTTFSLMYKFESKESYQSIKDALQVPPLRQRSRSRIATQCSPRSLEYVASDGTTELHSVLDSRCERGWVCAFDGLDTGAVLEDLKGGHGGDALSSRNTGLTIDVDLGKCHLFRARVFFGEGFECGRDHLARAAPVGID